MKQTISQMVLATDVIRDAELFDTVSWDFEGDETASKSGADLLDNVWHKAGIGSSSFGLFVSLFSTWKVYNIYNEFFNRKTIMLKKNKELWEKA